MRQLTLIRYGELSLRGGNREEFERRLAVNIRRALRHTTARVIRRRGRFYVEAEESEGGTVDDVLEHTFGLVAFSRVLRVGKNPRAVREAAVAVAQAAAGTTSTGRTFKIEARRVDKSYPLTSYETACDLGDAIRERTPHLSVDVGDPDLVVRVEIREAAYVWCGESAGPRGLPLGSSGRGLLLLSGGIDSPVAGYLMGARGLDTEAVYFHTPPFTSNQVLDKVASLCSLLRPYLTTLRLHVAPFSALQIRIAERGEVRETTLLMRACMMSVAEKLAGRISAGALITGESLGQVASQTIESLRFTGGIPSIPVLRPLVGMDKESIITVAKEIGTYETSILPYEDCCTLFAPDHPLIKPRVESIRASYELLACRDLEEDAAAGASVYDF